MPNSAKKSAIITGASGGIGGSIANGWQKMDFRWW
jgi:short-subunit dehydrogenase